MPRYSVPLQTWAGTVVYVETDSTDPEEIASLAEEQVEVGSLCHQCASDVDLGDVWEAVEFNGKPEVYKEEE